MENWIRPVDVISLCSTKGDIKPLRLRVEENEENILNCEYLIPDLISQLITKNKITVKYIPTKAKWYGVTYKEDKPKVVEMIRQEINQGKYEEDLWKNFKSS